MVTTTNKQFVVRRGATWVYLADLVDTDGVAVTQGAVSTITRTVIDPLGVETADDVDVANTVYDSAQTNATLWDRTFNFKDDVPAAKVNAAGRHRVRYTLAMVNGSTIKTDEIDVIGD
ncbi:MAG: hypothetical protein GY838_03710 [bacterium]|nr:hypothetical protein [bacterium]